MHFITLVPLLASMAFAQQATTFVTGQLGDAVQNFNNPEGAAYRAIALPNAHNVSAMITAITARDGATEFAVDIDNLPTEGGPFSYHIHVDPVAANGDCNSTLAHLDPFIRGEDTPCDPTQPQTCQVGDLGGKHGKANETFLSDSFTDPYVSLKEGEGAFFGNRSFVIHFANRTRIACGNFLSLSESTQPNLLNSSTTTSVAPAIATTMAPNGTTTVQTVAAATSLFFASATVFAPSTTSANAPLQVTASSATALQTNAILVLLACTMLLLSFS